MTAPMQDAADRIRAAVAGVPAGRLGDPAVFARAFPRGRMLGPAAIAHVSEAGFRPVDAGAGAGAGVELLPAGHPEPIGLQRAAGWADAVGAGRRIAAAAGCRRRRCRPGRLAVLTTLALRGLAWAAGCAGVRRAFAGWADAVEAGLDEITSHAFAVWAGGRIVAAASCRRRPCRTAHLAVLTALAVRGRGLA
ncbi:hypothetical protein [Kitasatospora sp. NPDC059462]|uniref:hypothetical protein n=1 Tax=Kitasatospora sp. NPDC059462 TaxID=3346841 RepID=UPI0036C0561F